MNFDFVAVVCRHSDACRWDGAHANKNIKHDNNKISDAMRVKRMANV